MLKEGMAGLGCQVLLFLSLIYVQQQIYYKEQTLNACNFIIENDYSFLLVMHLGLVTSRGEKLYTEMCVTFSGS